MTELQRRIRELAEAKKALILAHHYQVEEVKEVADQRGDSYHLAVTASRSRAEVVVLCGVRFMAESVAILSPEKTVLLPAEEAGCPLADTIGAADLLELRDRHPGVPVVSYVNTSAEVKALSDYCCTSANAVALVKAIDAPRVIFVPDMNLADYVARKTGKEIIPWHGFCHVHHRVKAADITALRERYPDALFLAHPECRPEVVALADEVSSTTGIMARGAAAGRRVVIIGTEEGVLDQLRRDNPQGTFITAVPNMVCPNMKLTTLPDVLRALEEGAPRVTVEEEIARKARLALERMVAVAG